MSNDPRTALFVDLQRGIPLTPRPFAELAEIHGLSEAEVMAVLERLFETGEARRFGAVFDVRRLGYRSSLLAARLTAAECEEIVACVIPVQGVTHCYLRGWPSDLDPNLPGGPGTNDQTPNLWFTFAALEDRFDADLEAIRGHFPSGTVHALPALRRFKIDVVLDPRSQRQEEKFPGSRDWDTEAAPEHFSEQDKRIIRAFQGNLACEARPFDPVAEILGCTPDALLERLTAWKSCGILRRVGVILHHRKVGFKANGMCVWEVPESDIQRAGRALSAIPEVTHCYQRPSLPRFPYSLYAMIHTRSWKGTLDLFGRISDEARLTGGRVLFSLREYKKTSPVYFSEGS